MTLTQSTRTSLQLLRAPNLLTVPGDPLAGAVLASLDGPWGGVEPVACASAAALCLYAAGLLLNDVADREVDRLERPGRPIPSGRARAGTVACAAAILAAVGVGAAFAASVSAGIVSLLLLSAIVSYTFLTRRWAFAACLNMGACRALSVWVGAAAAGWRPAGVDRVAGAAACMLLYTAAITALSRRETSSGALGAWRWLPPAGAALGLVLFGMAAGCTPLVTGFLAAAVLLYTGLMSVRLRGDVPAGRRQAAVGFFVRGMLLLQATFCSTWDRGVWPAAVLVACVPVAARLGRRFYGS